ncbi:MAG: hypothetical protein EBQ92_12645 [Proteobacteria bacterium]|nr:hypothetical protein [Pseudomonadota bacterium]
MFENWRNLRNQLDFFIRSRVRFERDLPQDFEIPPYELAFQEELSQFFELLKVKAQLKPTQKDYVICDVGTKNFSLAPVLDQLFLDQNKNVKIHGIEIDAYRRLSNLYTRSDYARFFSRKAREAQYHPIDFLKFRESLDVVFLLNPFVSRAPLLAWGLPLDCLKPKEIIEHAYDLLKSKKGFMVLGTPSEEELEIASELAKEAGFRLGPVQVWEPSLKSQQKKSRFGRLCLLNS